MKIEIIISIFTIAIIAIGIIIPQTKPVLAASTSDSMGIGAISAAGTSNNTTVATGANSGSRALSTSGSTEQPVGGESMAKSLILTAVAEKPFIKAGDKQTIHVRTAMDNGTGIPDVTVQALTQEYNSTTQKVLLGGQTDVKGNLDLTVTTGPHAKPGQFLIVANATKGDIKQSVASGFAVTDGGSSSSSSSSSGKCSGSNCK